MTYVDMTQVVRTRASRVFLACFGAFIERTTVFSREQLSDAALTLSNMAEGMGLLFLSKNTPFLFQL